MYERERERERTIYFEDGELRYRVQASILSYGEQLYETRNMTCTTFRRQTFITHFSYIWGRCSHRKTTGSSPQPSLHDRRELKRCARAQMAWVRSQLSTRSLLDASPQRSGFTCFMTRLSTTRKSSRREYDLYPTH